MKEKFTEYRVGNWVQIGRLAATVLSIDANGIQYDSHDGDVIAEFAEWKDVEPLWLTHDVMIKLGCVYNEAMARYEVLNWNPYVIYLHVPASADNSKYRLTTDRKDWLLSEFNYAHQLQNIYRALSHKELINRREA